MKSKKFAVRGMIVLACVVALCMFFSGTVRTIATAKVKILSPRTGKLSQSVTLTGQLRFPKSQGVKIENMDGYTLDIKSVAVEVGSEVKAGATLFTASVTDYDKTLASLRAEYDGADGQIQALERKNVSLRRSEAAWAEAYVEITDATEDLGDAKFAWEAQMRLEGLTEMPGEPSEALSEAWQRYEEKKAAYEQAQEKMAQAERFTISDEVRSYVADMKKYQDQRESAQEKVVSLMVLQKQVEKVCAQDAGYITKLGVEAGKTYDPVNEAYFLCEKGELPVIRCAVGDTSLTMSKGMNASLTSRYGYDLDTETIGVGVTQDGAKYVDVELDKDIIEEMGGLVSLAKGDVSVKIEYKAPQSTTLLPAAAVRGGGDDRYVYVVQSGTSAFGEARLTVSKTPVKVIAQAGDLISVEEDLSWQRVAYMEDRAISDGSVVMEYTE